MCVGDYDEALRQMNVAAENHELVQDPYVAQFIRLNFWSDPMLEQPEWVEMLCVSKTRFSGKWAKIGWRAPPSTLHLVTPNRATEVSGKDAVGLNPLVSS